MTARASESVADLYDLREITRGLQVQDEDFVHRFIYELEDPTKEFETLENMDKQTKLLFEIIKDQLANEEHPLHIVTKRFAFYYFKHYLDQLVFDEKSNDYYVIQEPITSSNNRYEVKFVNES